MIINEISFIMNMQSNLNSAPAGIAHFDVMSEYVNRDNKISQPSPYDVLCGKDKTYQQHPGNQIYRNYIIEYSLQYKIAKTNKQEKMSITKQILNNLKIGYNSRFIRKVDSSYTDAWEEISENEARDKISHALRFSVEESSVDQHDKKKMGLSKSNKRDSSMSSKSKVIDTSNQNKKLKAVEVDNVLLEDISDNKLVKRYDSIDSVMEDSTKTSQHSDNSTLNDMDQLDRQLYLQQQKILTSMRSDSYNNVLALKTSSSNINNMIGDKSNQMEELRTREINMDEMIIHDSNVEQDEGRCWSTNALPPSSNSFMYPEQIVNNSNNPNTRIENSLSRQSSRQSMTEDIIELGLHESWNSFSNFDNADE